MLFTNRWDRNIFFFSFLKKLCRWTCNTIVVQLWTYVCSACVNWEHKPKQMKVGKDGIVLDTNLSLYIRLNKWSFAIRHEAEIRNLWRLKCRSMRRSFTYFYLSHVPSKCRHQHQIELQAFIWFFAFFFEVGLWRAELCEFEIRPFCPSCSECDSIFQFIPVATPTISEINVYGMWNGDFRLKTWLSDSTASVLCSMGIHEYALGDLLQPTGCSDKVESHINWWVWTLLSLYYKRLIRHDSV